MILENGESDNFKTKTITMERPILFSTVMVQAILAGKKTQTRRVVKEPYQSYPVVTKHLTSCEFDFHHRGGIGQYTTCPYGKSNDVLWVRETWRPKGHNFPIGFHYEWKATAEEDGNPTDEPWKPSIFMPKEACRIKLLIKDIRVERVQDITEEDAIREGIGHGFQLNAGWPDYGHIKNGVCTLTQDTARMSFASLWDSIYKKRGYGWKVNPWVWIIEFESKY